MWFTAMYKDQWKRRSRGGGGGRGEGDGLWLLFQLGDEPGLEAVQGGSLHTSKAPEAVHSSLGLFLGRMTSAGIVLCRRERHRHFSQAHSAAAWWLWQVAGVYGDKATVQSVEHLQPGFLAALLWLWPFQGVHYGVGAECLEVPVSNPSCCSVLDPVNGADFVISTLIPNCVCILSRIK